MLVREVNVKKPDCIWTLEKIKLSDQTRTISLQRCGPKNVNRLHCIFNAELELGLQEGELMLLGKSEMIKMQNCNVDKKNSEKKKKRKDKLKYRGECIQRNHMTLIFYIMS